MKVDGLSSTRPIEITVERPEEADAMFDVLTYEKGASIVRMLEQYLGADKFRAGLRLYMKRHAYGNTETTDLWDAIEEGERRTGPGDHGHVDLPGRLPARECVDR